MLPYLSRCIGQFQLARPRDFYPKRTLRFWYFMVLFFNFPSIWDHALFGVAKGPSLILDFVGLRKMPFIFTRTLLIFVVAYQPSRLHVLLLDFVIIMFGLVLVTISYEDSLPVTNTSETSTGVLEPHEPGENGDPFKVEASPYIIDLRLGPIIERIRNPTPPETVERTREELLPLPNTMPAELRHSLRMLMRAREDIAAARGNNNGEQRRTNPSEPRNRGVPGAIDPDDEG